MTAADQHPTTEETEALSAQLSAERPHPSPALRKRVRRSIGIASGRRALRRRSAALVLAGSAVLAVAAVAALNAPS